ncbi:hypothetical protein [Escherichia coli]|uniref:hypothetical protein n=1 Tax=Escherichia coli TaxID=562 RepID=UPI001CCCD042|nr:hypothetical protein [Escherichia coli]
MSDAELIAGQDIFCINIRFTTVTDPAAWLFWGQGSEAQYWAPEVCSRAPQFKNLSTRTSTVITAAASKINGHQAIHVSERWKKPGREDGCNDAVNPGRAGPPLQQG